MRSAGEIPLRRSAVLASESWNGLDWIEVLDREAPTPGLRQRRLRLHFIRSFPADEPAPAGLRPDQIRIVGGERVQNIRITALWNGEPDGGGEGLYLTAETDRSGDFSPYTLRLVVGPENEEPPNGIDPVFAALEFEIGRAHV